MLFASIHQPPTHDRAEWQRRMIDFVAAHRAGFATPQRDGSIFIYSYCSGPACGAIVRDSAKTTSEVLSVLGY